MSRALVTMLRILTFRVTREELLNLGNCELGLGLAMTWLAGIGRYWDHTTAGLAQHLGVGSLVYVFVLALLLWGVGAPLRLQRWRYRDVLTFITLTSAPAILYAIPVERFLPIEAADSLNAVFLGIVALWRVVLWFQFLRRYAELPIVPALIVEFLPLAAIVVGLAFLNLEHATFDVMGGGSTHTSHDISYGIVVMLSCASIALALPLLIAWIVMIVRAGQNLEQTHPPC